MNLSIIEVTQKKIELEAKKNKKSFSTFIINMVGSWNNQCKLSKIPAFENGTKIVVNVYSDNTEGRIFEKSIKERQFRYFDKFGERLTHWQIIEAAWVWHNFKKEGKDGKTKT